MANALVTVDDDGLACEHRKNVTLRTNRGARRAADAMRCINMRMLRLWPVRTQTSPLRGLAGASLLSRLRFEISPHVKERNDRGNQEAEKVIREVIHIGIFSQNCAPKPGNMTMDWSGWGFHRTSAISTDFGGCGKAILSSIRIYEGGIQLHLVNESHHEQAKSQRRNHHRAWRPEQDPCLRAQTACRFSHFPSGISTLTSNVTGIVDRFAFFQAVVCAVGIRAVME
jgi:hypothetical protein